MNEPIESPAPDGQASPMQAPVAAPEATAAPAIKRTRSPKRSTRGGGAAAAKEQREYETLQKTLKELSQDRRRLSEQLDRLALGQQELRRALLGTNQRLSHRDDEIQSALYDLALRAAEREGVAGDSINLARSQMVRSVRETIRSAAPIDATVLVASGCSDELLNLYSRTVIEFPVGPTGQKPPSEASLIIQLEAQRGAGADFLLMGGATHWLFDEFPRFRRHVEAKYREVGADDRTYRLFDLRRPKALEAEVWLQTLRATADSCERSLGIAASILDWNTGLDISGAFPELSVSPVSSSGASLPYLPETFDIVVVRPGDKVAAREATRIARAAVISVAVSSDEVSGANRVKVRWTGKVKPVPLASASIIIPVYGAIQHTRTCLRTLNETLPPDFNGEVIVVDDASDDETATELQLLAAQDPRLRLIRNKKNMGFVASCNRGARAAKGEFLVFLNNDTLPQQGFLENLLDTFRLRPDAGAVGGKLVYPDGTLQEAGGVVFSDASGANFGRSEKDPDAPLFNFLREVDYCSGALLATPRALFLELGGFDVLYRPAYYEDTDYCFQVRQRGLAVYYQPASEVIHLEGISSGRDLAAGVKKFQTVNLRKFATKWRQALAQQPAPMDLSQLDGWDELAHYPRFRRGTTRRNIKRALVCAPVMPEFDRESGSRRIYDLLVSLRDAGWAVSFVAQRAPNGERYSRMLEQQGIATYVGFNLLTDRLIVAGRFDLAIFEFWDIAEQHLPFIRRVSPSTRVIVDSIDLHFMRNSRRVFLGGQKRVKTALLDANYGAEMARELNVYAAADTVLAVSQKEATMINDFLGDGSLARVVPDSEALPLSSNPFEQRNGILFLGSFRHTPNIDAAEYLCKSILPKVNPALLAKHPVYIVGTGLTDTVRSFADGLPNVRVVGWVPSVVPYLETARITVIPLLYGAGTKRKLVQALMSGTPTVSTSIGTEGLNLTDGEHVLVADDATTFARSIERLLVEQEVWERLRTQARQQIEPAHSRATAHQSFVDALSAAMKRAPKPAKLSEPNKDQRYRLSLHYQQLTDRIRDLVQRHVPAQSTMLVVSKGDETILDLPGRHGWHFPQTDTGLYAGHHPSDSREAITHLEALRRKGADYILFPLTSMWWLDHYSELREHLDRNYRLLFRRDDACAVYSLRTETAAPLLENGSSPTNHVHNTVTDRRALVSADNGYQQN